MLEEPEEREKNSMKKKIEKGTIVRTGVLVFALANQALTISGHNPLPFSEDEV